MCDGSRPSVKLPLQLVHHLQDRLLLLLEFSKVFTDHAILGAHLGDFALQAGWRGLRSLCAGGTHEHRQGRQGYRG